MGWQFAPNGCASRPAQPPEAILWPHGVAATAENRKLGVHGYTRPPHSIITGASIARGMKPGQLPHHAIFASKWRRGTAIGAAAAPSHAGLHHRCAPPRGAGGRGHACSSSQALTGRRGPRRRRDLSGEASLQNTPDYFQIHP
jgi:hypothetical protein